ncbi:CCR4-NOT core subunit cdc39 [Saxophila tyrrhenica]|uniref:General negative regulator of transcription subunit 1 n=1 Tax=Saxophila tyrrhenica TaxID=1690608 RepID=A0AAV9PD84_9PEZI|nr:CCR4-NOT core subunit cdc39 [Saxophila tyrrhenica]
MSSSSTPNDPVSNTNPTAAPSSSRSTRPQGTAWSTANSRQASRRGITPITTGGAGDVRPGSSSDSPSRAVFGSPTSLTFNPAAVGANRHASSRQSSNSSTTSFASPTGSNYATGPFQSGSRSRAVTSTSSPRLASSLASLPSTSHPSTSGVGAGSGSNRLARHSPSLSHSTAGSPISSTAPQSAGGLSQLTSLVITQLNILLSTLRENNFDTQAERIRSLVDENGMEVFTTFFRRLLQSNASTIFPGAGRPPATADSNGQFKLLADEMAKISREPQQAEKIAQSLDTSESELFRDFDLSTFIEYFRLSPIAKVALVLPIRSVSKPDLRSKADAILTNNLHPFLQAASSPPPPSNEYPEDASPSVLAALLERLMQEPPRNWTEEQRENLIYAVKVRYNRLGARIPPALESAMFVMELLESQDSRLARLLQRTGPRGTSSLDACKEMLAGVETRDISYPQIANALLFIVCVQNGESYDAGVFVNALRQHRAGSNIDWTDVVQGFDKDQLRVSKRQFLALYNALLPLARGDSKFDVQSLWSGQWQFPETQLSFVVAFLSTITQELDVTQIPNLRQAFTIEDFEDGSASVKAFAAEAVKHPLVSRDATEALFSMIFRSQDTYNHAQMLGIPDSIINPNMTIFVCAASAVPKPWAALQDQALKQLFYPFLLKQHQNYDFVMHSLWLHDKSWVAGRMVEFYQQDQMLLHLIFEHAQEQGWLELLLTIQSSFAVDLATYAHGKGHCNLEDWARPHIETMTPPQFARAILDFLSKKIEDEAIVQRARSGPPHEQVAPTTQPLAIKTIYLLLLLINDSLPDDDSGPFFRQCLGIYPRLFNYGDDEKIDDIIEANGNTELGHTLPEETAGRMEEQYKAMYGGTTSPDDLIKQLKQMKQSENPADQDLFAAMMHGLFDEYNCFGEYPNEALATTAVLFGGLVQFHVLSTVAEQAAIFMIFEAVQGWEPNDQMYRFGLQALIHLLGRLRDWPGVSEKIIATPSLEGTQAVTAAQAVLAEQQQEAAATNGDTVNGLTNGALDEEFPVDAPNPPFSSIQVDPPLRPDVYEDPSDDASDKVMFVLNNVSKRNLEEKFKDLKGALQEKHHQWFAHYLVEELARTQPNFQSLYLQLLENFNKKILWQEVLRETYASCAKMLNAESTMNSSVDRNNLKNLAGWLGSMTLAREQPILHRNLSFKDLLFEGQDTQRLIVAIPFTCKALFHAKDSKVFRPPNPWMMELLSMLSELYHYFELKLNLKFEIEVLCKDLKLDIKDIEPADIIRNRRLVQENSMLQQFTADGPDGFGDVHIMGLSKRAPNERFSPEAVIQAIPDLGGLLQIPQAAGNVTQPQLRTIFVNAAQQAIFEIIAPVVERSVTIAAISAAELIQKDFSAETDSDKLRSSAYTMVKSLSGSLALVTCKEPLRMSIMNNIRILASRTLPEQLPEGQIIMFVNDNIDTVCGLVERAAEEHSKAEIDAQMAEYVEARRRHTTERPNEPFNNPPISRWAQLIPEPFRMDLNGLNRQQLALYEDFGRQARITPAQHANSQSQDNNRQIPDVLTDSYLPSLTTPAEQPAMPRQTPQQQRMYAGQAPQAQQMNGYTDHALMEGRIVGLLTELQAAARESPAEHVGDIGDDSPIRRIFSQLYALINSSGFENDKESLANLTGQKCFFPIFDDFQTRLEMEVFVRLLKHLSDLSPGAGRQFAVQLAMLGNDLQNPLVSDLVFRNASVTATLLTEHIWDMQHVDNFTARNLRLRRPIVLPYLNDLLDEVLLGDKPIALRADFVYTYEALGQWLSEDHGLEIGRQIMSKLQTPVEEVNGMPSPPGLEKQEQLEYMFEEWISMQRRDTTLKSYIAFVRQMHDHRVLDDPNDAAMFIRTCLEMSSTQFNRASNQPWVTQDAPYVYIDALAKLAAFMVVFQSPVDGEPQAHKGKSLDAIIRLVVLIMNDHHNKQQERWNGRLYFRFFSSLLCELHDARQHLGPQQVQDLMQVFALSLMVMQPKYFSGFTFSWLTLLGHRLFIPHMLAGNGRSNGGWESYAKLLNVLFVTLGDFMNQQEAPAILPDFYRGVTRLVLVLHHDFAEFLLEHHVQLNSSIPPFCFQLHNIINSAVTRAIIADQPDPFMPGLKVNRLEQIRQQPSINMSFEKTLAEAGIKDAVQRCCGSEVASEEIETILTAIDRTPGTTGKILLFNTISAYVGTKATSTSSSFSAAAPPALLLARLLKELQPENRYYLITAMLNQVRYVNAHTHYFSTALQHFFTSGNEDVQQAIMRAICERLGVPRPHPWGLIVMVLELVKNPAVNVFELGWMKEAKQVEDMLMSLVQNSERVVQGLGGRG